MGTTEDGHIVIAFSNAYAIYLLCSSIFYCIECLEYVYIMYALVSIYSIYVSAYITLCLFMYVS